MKVLMTLDNPFTHDARVYKEAQSLVENGYDVTVLAWDKHGKHPKNEMKDGIKVVRSYNTKLMDMIDHDYVFRNPRWWSKGYSDAKKIYEKESFDIVHSHDLKSLPIGVRLKKKYGIHLIYDSHEHWEFSINNEMPSPLSNYYLWKERQGLNQADHIITVCKPIQKYFREKGYLDVTIIRNCKKKVTEKYIPPSNDVFTLIYIGVFNGKRFTPKAIEACKDIEGVKFKVAGYGSNKDEIINLINCTSKKKAEFLGRIDVDRVIPETLKADAVLCMFDPKIKNNQIGLPNKLFEAMVCGRPIIVSKNTYAGKLVEKLDIGLAVNYDKEGFKSALIKLRDNPELRKRLGKNALKTALLRYNWEIEEKQLLEVYEKVSQ